LLFASLSRVIVVVIIIIIIIRVDCRRKEYESVGSRVIRRQSV